jgi:hypothetical protein
MSETWERLYAQTPVAEPRDSRLQEAAPCPFCGSRMLEFSRVLVHLHCCNCGADGPEVNYTRDPETRWRCALARWNQRQ